MKKATIMIILSLAPRMLVADEVDPRAMAGENWYGLYFTGQKAGYAVERLTVEEDGTVFLEQDAQFKIAQGGIPQDIQVIDKRTYEPGGALIRLSSEAITATGVTRFEGFMEGDSLLLKMAVGGQESETTLPRPRETFRDALREARLVQGEPKIGDSMKYSRFELMFQKEIDGESRIAAVEERVLNGAPTKVYRIETKDVVDSVSWVTADGLVLEDMAGMNLTMRLEPREAARNVDYSNDVIISNAALVEKPIENPRERDMLRLLLEGPLEDRHLINDVRQAMTRVEGDVKFEGRKATADGLVPVSIPVEHPEVVEWTQPSTFVQSSDPRLVEKARAIIGAETDALAASRLLCTWVYENVRTTYTASLSNALEVLNTLKGDCTEHSILFIGLARAVGIPAREVAGLVYVSGSQPGFYFHQWATIWAGGWIDVDPTFNQPFADATHIKLAEGDLYAQTQLIPIIGRIHARELTDEAPAQQP